MRTPAIAVVVLFLLNSNAHGEPNDELATRLVKLLRYEEQIGIAHEECVRGQGSVTPESLVSRDHAYFDGLDATSPKWPKIVSAFAEYRQQICSRPTASQVMKVLSDAYARSMTEKQLRESIDFYSSDIGRALTVANQKASAATSSIYSEASAKYASDLTAELSRKIRAIASEK